MGGVLAALMRLQLSRPDNAILGPDLYNQIFTTHGTTMMFLFAVPVMQGLGIYFVPLMVGARSIAFPRLSPSATGCCSSAGSFSMFRFCWVPDRMWAGSRIRLSPNRSTRRANAPTSGRS